MLFKRFYDDNLAQASYMIACEKTREAIVVDPNVDVGMYTRAAGADRVRIVHVTETHIHADFVSGAQALAVAAGATLHLSGEGNSDWAYTKDALAKANVLKDGDRLEFGRVRMCARHTPGHTPEHLTFLVSDLERGEDPVGALTGDFIFVGDVGRPDLLERAAGERGTMEAFARQLFQSVTEFRSQADHLQIWPGHGAGSACGRSLGAMPQSTLGYEKLFNWALADLSEDEFVEKVLTDQPVPPRYFAVMKRVNRAATTPARTPAPKNLEIHDLNEALREKAIIVDTRPAERFAAGHVPSTLNIPLGKSFLNWVGAFVPENSDISLIVEADNEDAVKSILHDLCKIGITRVRGVFGGDVIREWKSRGGGLEGVAQLDAAGLAKIADAGRRQIIDVRSPEEWSKGHLPGATHIPLAALPDRLDELDKSVPIVLHCKGGGRSSIAASFIQSRGISNVSNLAGGYEAWIKHGFSIEDGKPVPATKTRKKE
ncbi:MAG TPA: MBL fold metallo-hydrolase [Gemmatimonadaceae bacterium]|nr:MBL fold metallo-hydrolase [Gemmatimonadaceae bacterium]